MNQADVSKVVSKLRFKLNPRRKMSQPEGPQGRINKLRKTVTALIKHERIELHYHRGDEARGYAERLISDAIRNGDCHKETMEMASYWLVEKQLVHKLFKVLAPRYKNLPVSYTRMWKAPYPYDNPYPGVKEKCVLELRNNVYPPLDRNTSNNRHLIHNVLLEEARREFRSRKYAELAEKLAPTEIEKNTEQKVDAVTENIDNLTIESNLKESEPVVRETK